MSYTSNSEFENNHVSYTNEIPPYDYYEGVHSLLTDDIWKWLLGYSEIEYDNDHKDIVNDLGNDPLYEGVDYYHKSVNGTESTKYGPSSKEYFYENLTEDSFIKIAEYSKIKDLNLANYPTLSDIESEYKVKLTDLEISTSTFNKLPLKRVTSIDLMTEPGYIYLLNITDDMYDKYCVFSKIEKGKEYRTLVKLGIKVKYEKYHTMNINGVLLPEEDLFLHEIYRYFETLYPDNPDWTDLLTNNEVNDAINNAAAMVNYQPDNNFFELVARNLETDENNVIKEAFKIKLRNLTNNAYRRKLYGSRYGYRMFGADIFENLLIYPMGTYIPIKPIDVALTYNGKAITESNISEFDSSLFEVTVPPKNLYNRYVDQYDSHYYNKFRLIDWTGSSHTLNKSDNLATYNIDFFAVPGYENCLFENIYTLSDYLDYLPGFILDKDSENFIINKVDTKDNYRIVDIGKTDESMVQSCQVTIFSIPTSSGTDKLEENSSISGESFLEVLNSYLEKPETETRTLDIYPCPFVNNAFITKTSENLKIYPTAITLEKNPDINAKEKIICVDNENNIEPALNSDEVLKQGEYLYVKDDNDLQLHVIQNYERATLNLEFNPVEKYRYMLADLVYEAAAYAVVIENYNGDDVVLFGRITDIKCFAATESSYEQPASCKFIISAIPETVPEGISISSSVTNNRDALCNDYKYNLYKSYDSNNNTYTGLRVKKIYVYDGSKYIDNGQFSTGTVTYINYGYWKAMPIYLEKSFINSIYSPYSYDFPYEGSLFLTDAQSIMTNLGITLNKALLQESSPFDFLNKIISCKTSKTLTYFNKATTSITIESKIEISSAGENNVISFESEYAKELFKNLSIGDIVMGPGLPDVNQDIFITSLGDNQITVNVKLTKAGTFNLVYKCSLNAINEDKFDLEDDFEQRLSNIGALEVMNPWKHGLYGSDSYPNVANALLDGLSDIKYFKPYINSEGTVYFTDVIMPALHGNKLKYFTKSDVNLKPVAKNMIIPCTIKYIGDVFIDVALNKLCTLPNKLGQTDNLITVEWLDYLTNNVLELSRASDKVQFGAHLLMETDSSGFMSQDSQAVYTDPSVHTIIQTFNWDPNKVPGFAQIGTGGKDGFIKFKSKSQHKGMSLWGNQLWDNGHLVDTKTVLIQPTVEESEKNAAIGQTAKTQLDKVYTDAYDRAYNEAHNKGQDEAHAIAAGKEAAQQARNDLLEQLGPSELGKGELKSRSIWGLKQTENSTSSYTEIAKPVAQINFGEYDVQLHYDGDKSNGNIDVTTIQANFYKQTFKNIVNDDTENMKVAPRSVIDNNFILNDVSKIEKLEKIFDENSRTDTLTETLAEETQLFIGKVKKYVCLGYWTPSMKSGKIDWPCEKAILEKAYAQDIIYYYIIDHGAVFTGLSLTPENDIDTRSDKYNEINSFNTYDVEFADQSILTITPCTVNNEITFRWSNKKLSLVGLFGDLSGNVIDSSYNVYPTFENTWLNVILHRALGAYTGFAPTNRMKGPGATPYIGTYAFCPGYKGGFDNEDCKVTLSSIIDYLEAFGRFYNDGSDETGRYTARSEDDSLYIDGDLIIDRTRKIGRFAEVASNVFILSLIDKKINNTITDEIYAALNPDNANKYGAFIAAIPEYDFGKQEIVFNIVELSANSFFVQNLKKDNTLVSSSEYEYFNSSDSLWQRFNNNITSRIELPRKMIAEGSYNFDFIIDPEFRGEVYNYDEYIKYLNGELDIEDLTVRVEPITTSAIFYEEDKDIFYIQLQHLNDDYCSLITKYNLTIQQLLLDNNQDPAQYSVDGRTVLMLHLDIDTDNNPANFFITSSGEKICYKFDTNTLETSIYKETGEPFDDGDTVKIIGTNGESIIAIYEDTLAPLTPEEISRIDVKYFEDSDNHTDGELNRPTNILANLYENSEYFRAIVESSDGDPNEYLLSKEDDTYAMIFKKGIGNKIKDGYQVSIPVASSGFIADPDDSSNTVVTEKFVIPFNENYYYKNLKYITCNYQLIKSQTPGDENILETPTITKVEGEAFDINSLTLTDRLLKLTPVQLRSIERSSLKPTFFSSYTKIKGQLVNIDTVNKTIKVTYDIGSLVFPDGQTDKSDQMVTLASRSDFSEQLNKLLPARYVYNEDTQEDDLIVDSNTVIDFSNDYTWHNEKIAAPQVVSAVVSSRFKTAASPTMEFKYFKNLLLIEADISGDDPRTLSLKGNSTAAVSLIDSDDTIVSAIPLSAQSGEFTKTCAIYCNMPGGYQVALLVDYIYHGNGYIIGTSGTIIYYEKVTSLEGKTRVNLTQGVSLGSYEGYRVVDITYANNYFYITLGDSAGNRVLKRVIGDIDLAQESDVTDIALSAPIIWTENVYSDPDATELYAKAGDNYIPSDDTIYDSTGTKITNPQAEGKAATGAIDSGMILVSDAYDKFNNKIGNKGQSLDTPSEVYSKDGIRIDKPFTYGTKTVTVADWLSDTLNMPSELATVFDYDIIHGRVSVEHTDYIIDASGNVVPQTVQVYPEYSSMETSSAASPLFAASSDGYEAMLIGKTLFLKSPTATASEGQYDGEVTTFMHWKKVDLPVSLNDFRNSFKSLTDEEFYDDILEIFATIEDELSNRSNTQNAGLTSSISAIISNNFMTNGHLITLDEFTAKYESIVESGSSTGYTFKVNGVSYSDSVASIKSDNYTTYNITPDPTVPANDTYNTPHYAYTYREMFLDFMEYVCGAADNTKLFTESALKMYFEDDSLYIQTSNRDIISISAVYMTKRPDLENAENWNLVSISGEVTILSAPDENATYRIDYNNKEYYIEALTVRRIRNFADVYATYNADSMKFMGGKLDSAVAIRNFLDTHTVMTADAKSAYVKTLYSKESYTYESPVLLMSVDDSNYTRVVLPELKIINKGQELIVGKDFSAYISSIKKIGDYIYAFVKADLDHSNIYSPLSKALRIMKNANGEWSLSYPTEEKPETTPYDLIWVDTYSFGISTTDLTTYANSSDFVTSGSSKLGYDSVEPFNTFTYPSIMNTELYDGDLSITKVINGKVLLNNPMFAPSRTNLTFLIAIKTKKQVYDQTLYLNSENYDSYTSKGKFIIDSVVEVSSPREADRMYNKREVMPTAERPDGVSAEDFEKYIIADKDGYPSVAEDKYHIYYKYDIYGSDYYAKDWYNKDHNEIKLCNIDGDYFIQNNAATPVAVRYANTEKLLQIGASVDIAYNAPYAEYNSVAAASRSENARPLDEGLSNEMSKFVTGVKEICLDNDNPYMILSYSGALLSVDYTAIQNYEKYVEFNIYVPYIHASPTNSADNMLFNVTKTWDEETGKLKSGILADLADGLPVSAVYIPMNGYGSTRDNTIDWDKQDDYKPWTIDPKAFEHHLSTSNEPVFYDLKNSVNRPVYLCKANGELIRDSKGEFVTLKVPKYLDISSLVTGEDGYEIEFSLVKKNETLGSLENSRNSIGYIEQIDTVNTKFTLKEKLTLENIDLNDGEKHIVMFTILTVEPVTLNPKVMNNPEYFIEISPHEKNIFGYDRICWNPKGYPRSPIKIGNDIFYSENNSKYELSLFADPFGTPVYECDKDGYYIGFAKKKVDGVYQLEQKGRLDTAKDGDLSKFVTASHDYRFRPYTPKYSSCQDWFKDEFYLSGQEKNPYWQVIHIQANYNSTSMQYDQISKVQEYVKVGSTMNLKDLSSDESYVTVKRPTRITTVKGVKFIEPNAPYLDCKYGLIDMILIPAASGTKYNPVYESDHSRQSQDIYVKYGISARIPWDDMDDYHNIFDTSLENLTSVHNYFCGSWSVNTLENFIDKTDKDKAITQINELGIFDTQGNLMIYATFPAIEYRTDTQHIDFTIIVNNDKNIVNNTSDAAPSIESE